MNKETKQQAYEEFYNTLWSRFNEFLKAYAIRHKGIIPPNFGSGLEQVILLAQEVRDNLIKKNEQ